MAYPSKEMRILQTSQEVSTIGFDFFHETSRFLFMTPTFDKDSWFNDNRLCRAARFFPRFLYRSTLRQRNPHSTTPF